MQQELSLLVQKFTLKREEIKVLESREERMKSSLEATQEELAQLRNEAAYIESNIYTEIGKI